ncbi:MAG: PP2C family protein-serine/threonine phosphatase, partial [Bdellovibrionales bacterium]|nr:PP2C family protein-serine/threonine phosphatase [Bdellovibrionales bacterium]
YRNYLVNSNWGMISGPQVLDQKKQEVFFPLYNQALPFGVKEIEFLEGQKVYAAFSEVGRGNLLLVSIVNKKEALQALEKLSAKSLIFMIAFISFMILVSILVSVKLTVPITALMKASENISEGKFDIELAPSSEDEIGQLTQVFNQMANQMSHLLDDKMEQARLSTELKTVQTLQENLFPRSKSKIASVDINGFFEPASEAGGDWWFYYRKDNKFWLWIGDATGHGAPAAMLTSTARGASALIEYQDVDSPGEAMDILNKAIYGVGQGKMMMTFFLAVIDLETGEIQYSNASHEYPYIVGNLTRPTKKRDLNPLIDVRGPRLGQSPESHYEVSTAQLEKGDTFVLYTDGVIDLEDKDGVEMGERKFLKILCESLSAGSHVNKKMSFMVNEIKKHQGPQTKVDDVTMDMAQYNP